MNAEKKQKLKERSADIVKAAAVIEGAAWLCFKSVPVCLAGLLFLPLCLKFTGQARIAGRQAELEEEFKNVTAMIYSSTAAGGTLEKSIRDAARDMRRTPARYGILLPEFDRMCLRLDRNVPMNDVLADFSDRMKNEDIESFVRILMIAGKSGGSLAEIVRHTADTINMRLEINSEIETILAGKRGEWLVMLVIPPAIILYMNLFSGDYMSVLYETFMGRVIMICALAAYVGAVWIGQKILNIHV